MNTFDQAAIYWDANPERLKLNQELRKAIIEQLPLDRRMTALDFGCGTGIMAWLLAGHLKRIDAVDSSSGMIEELTKKLKRAAAPENIFPHNGLLQNAMFPDQSFDLIYSVLTLHHIEDIQRLLTLFFRLLKPGGRIALLDLDSEDGSFHPDNSGIHHFGFDRNRLKALLMEIGFSKLEDCTAGSRRRDSGREYPVFLISAQK